MTLFTNNGAYISPCGKYRYTLWRIWDSCKPLVLFICLNPSTGDATQDDPTIRRLKGFASGLGYGGFYIGNLFAYRATEPDDLKQELVPVGPENEYWLHWMSKQCKEIIFAWGTHGKFLQQDKKISKMLSGYKPMCFGITKDGYPKHPLYLKSATELIQFTKSNIEEN